MENVRLPDALHLTNSAETGEFDYRILKEPALRAEYITYTDALVRKLVENQTDTAIFLDKSARPVAWMVNEMWDILAPRNKDGQIAKKPTVKFLNIDREQWGAVLGRSEDEGGYDARRLPSQRLDELRQLYAPIKNQSQPGEVSLLSGKNVMVVDEVRVSGDTLGMSHDILQLAFPDAASIKGAYWMDGKVTTDARSGGRKNTNLPVWYSDTRVTGRLVGNRDANKSAVSPSSRQTAGRYWLSTSFRHGRDVEGLQLKNEVRQLAADLRQHRILYKPASGWEDSELDNRMERINGISTDQFRALIQTSKDTAAQIELYLEYVAHQKRSNMAKNLGSVSLDKI